MKIDEFQIMRYPPLLDVGRIQLHNFNLFFGRNEDGKTLTIDALVKLMFGQNIKDFKGINRVEENPEGYVIVEDDENRKIKVPEKGTFAEITNLTPSECRNIFIIRNSDLSISSESDFYITVTDRLVGIRTKELLRIKDSLREIGKLTPNYEFRNSKDEKLKTRIEKAGYLIEKIDVLSEEIKKGNFDKLEEEKANCVEEIDRIKQQIEFFEDSRKREMYEKGKNALDKLKKDLVKLKELDSYNEDDERIWGDFERDIQTYSDERDKLSEELEKNEKEFRQTNEKLGVKELDFQVLQDVKKELDNEVKPLLKTYEIKSSELALQKNKSKFFTSMGLVSAILLGISIFAAILSSSFLFYALVVTLSILTTVSWILEFQHVRNKASLAKLFERIKLTTSKHELSTENIEGIFANIQKFDEEYSKKNNELQGIKRKSENLQDKLNEIRDNKIPALQRKIAEANETIGKIKRKSKEVSLRGYTKNLRTKHKFEKSLGEHEGILGSLFEPKSKNLEENLPFWDEEINNLEEYKSKAKEIKYNEKTVSTLKEKQKKLEEKQVEIDENMSEVQGKLEEIEREENEILRSEEHLCCSTSVDLEAIKKELQLFANTNENNRDNALKAIEIFEEIEKEEKNKISELFGRDSIITKYLSEITGGLYKGVYFNQDVGGIQVERKDGEIFEAEKLSGGTYDQLYLSIRLALGEKLLKGNKAFFIMDDPFIKADKGRLQKQVNILSRISKSGWQIIYFTAKDEVRDILRKDIKSNQVNYVEIQPIYSTT
jgi:hypothetical protein